MKIDYELASSGPYHFHFVRHPIYTGVLTALFSSGLVNGPFWMVVFVAAALIFTWRIRVEETYMMELFPGPISGISRKDEGADSYRVAADGGSTTPINSRLTRSTTYRRLPAGLREDDQAIKTAGPVVSDPAQALRLG